MQAALQQGLWYRTFGAISMTIFRQIAIIERLAKRQVPQLIPS